MLADTGNPCAIIISQQTMQLLGVTDGIGIATNFGFLEGGWLTLAMPELGLDQSIRGYASDKVVAAVRVDHMDFQGLAGLPLLRLVEYGGSAEFFWLRRANAVRP